MWVIGGGVGVIGGGIRRTSLVCRDPTQPRFGHISSCKPHSDYLSVPDMRRKCYKIPPENELCLCEDIFQQHQAKLVNCDVEDASAVESYKEPSFGSNENTYDGSGSSECCCTGDKDGDESPKLSSLSSGECGLKDDRKSSLVSSVTATAITTTSSSSSSDLAVVPVDDSNRQLSEKLTAEERDKVLKELDDIITGNFLTKVRRFSQDVQSDSSDDHRGVNQLQLTHVATTRLRGKRSSSLDTDEIVNYGKVAELTRRFSRLGEAGILGSQHYSSEPNFFGDPSSAGHYRHYDNDDDSSLSFGIGVGDGDGVACSSGDDYEVVRQPIRMVFIRPMSVSDDQLNNRNCGGAVLTEVTSDGENDARQTLNATQNRRRSFRKSVAFDSSLSSVDGGSGDEAAARYRRLKGGWQSVPNQHQDHHRTSVNYSKSSDSVSVSNLGRSHRRYSSVDVYDQVNNLFLDVEKTEKEFRDGLLAEKNRRREAIQEYMANKELLLIKMKSASVGGILRWNQEHQDTLLDDEEPLALSPPPMLLQPPLIQNRRSSSSSEEGSPKDGLRRVLHTGLKGRRIRRLRKLESRSNGFSVADLWRVSKDELPPSSRHSTGCSSAEPLDKHNDML